MEPAIRPLLGLPAAALVAVAGAIGATASGQDAPLFTRPFSGVPVDAEEAFGRIVDEQRIGWQDDHLRALDPGAGPAGRPPALGPSFTDQTTTSSTTGMTVGNAYFGQFVSHDVTLTRLRFDEVLVEPFVFRVLEIGGEFINRRTPGLDLDCVYRISPLEFPSQPGSLGPWDLSNLRFRFGTNEHGRPDFIRGPSGIALIGDSRNDENGVVAQIHRAFMKLHNVQVDRIIARDSIDEAGIVFLSQEWWDIFNEARNYTTAYYQGLVANELAAQLAGRTLYDALDDTTHPVGPLAEPVVTLEMAACVFRLHTLVPVEVQVGGNRFMGPVDEALRNGVAWPYLFGPVAPPSGALDLAVAAPLRNIVNLVIPGVVIPITIDLAQVNVLRGREVRLPSGEEYLAMLMEELGLDPPSTTSIRGKTVLTPANAAAILDPTDDADLLADLANGDTDLWAWIQLEAMLNGGMLGPVGQDVLERNWLGLLLADDWSLLGANSDQFTPQQMAFFQSATFVRLLDEIISLADLDRSGHVDVNDFFALLTDWGLPGSPADLDGDGTVGVKDLDILVGEWGL
jgi:hypothetical protein